MSEGRIVRGSSAKHLFSPTPSHERSRQFPGPDSLKQPPESSCCHNGYNSDLDTGPQARWHLGFRGRIHLLLYLHPAISEPSFFRYEKGEAIIRPPRLDPMSRPLWFEGRDHWHGTINRCAWLRSAEVRWRTYEEPNSR